MGGDPELVWSNSKAEETEEIQDKLKNWRNQWQD